MDEDTTLTQPPVAAPKRRGRPPGAKTETPFAPVTTRRAGRKAAAAEAAPAPDSPPPVGRLKRNRIRTDNRFHIPLSMIPPGVSYEWKRASVFGKPDPYHLNGLRENHWTPVPASRHPGILVEQDGQILMERPKYLTDEAHREDFNEAQQQVQIARKDLAQGPDGTLPRRGAKLNTDYDLAVQGGTTEERR